MRLFTLAALLFTASGPASASDCASELSDILTRSAFAGPFHVDSRVVSPTGEQRIRGDVIPRSAVHLMVLADGNTSEIIVAEGEGWLNLGRDWASLPADMAWSLPSRFGIAVVEDIAEPQDVACLGPETHGGRAYLAFSYSHAGEGYSGSYRILVDPIDMLQARVEARLTFADGSVTTTSVGYEYDSAIVIAPPDA